MPHLPLEALRLVMLHCLFLSGPSPIVAPCCPCCPPAGGDLYRRLVRAQGLLAEADVCRDVVVPLLLTLTFLHANHIVHRWVGSQRLGRLSSAVCWPRCFRCCSRPSSCFASGGLGWAGPASEVLHQMPRRLNILPSAVPVVLCLPASGTSSRRTSCLQQMGGCVWETLG